MAAASFTSSWLSTFDCRSLVLVPYLTGSLPARFVGRFPPVLGAGAGTTRLITEDAGEIGKYMLRRRGEILVLSSKPREDCDIDRRQGKACQQPRLELIFRRILQAIRECPSHDFFYFNPARKMRLLRRCTAFSDFDDPTRMRMGDGLFPDRQNRLPHDFERRERRGASFDCLFQRDAVMHHVLCQ